jgi:glutathione synthase/RimK-type ligase-like ATP-grasp enzyme
MKTKKNKKYFQMTKKNKKKTFYLDTDVLYDIENTIKNILKKEGYVESNKFPVDLICVYEKAAYYKNRLNAKGTKWINNVYGSSFDIITNKLNLYKRFGKQSFFIPTIFIENNFIPKITGKKLKILKPVKGSVGTGIKIVQSRKEVKDWLEKNPNYKDWVLQDYILEPDLFNGYKFHIRMYILLILRKTKPIELYVANSGFIITSLKKYKKEDLEDNNIHNTHFKGRNEFEIFPKFLPDGWTKNDGDQKIKEIKNIMKFIFENEQEFIPAWKAENAFCLFGADIMFENKQTYLIELNKFPTIGSNIYLIDHFNIIFNKPQSTYEQIL